VRLVFSQKQINILQKYCEKWLLTTNLKKTKILIFQKQNRKSTREKYIFFLNGMEIQNTHEYTYLGVTFYSNGSFSIAKQRLVEKTTRSIFACKRYMYFLYTCATNFLISYFVLYYSAAQRYGDHTTNLISRNGKKIPLRDFIHNFINIT
jgi:hypothetical protein